MEKHLRFLKFEKLFKLLMRSLITLSLFILPTLQLRAADYYWVNNSGNWSDYSAHWATSSGGSTFHTAAPSATDNVYFDANSFSSTLQAVTLDVAGYCNNLDWTGVLNNPDFQGWNDCNVYGSLKYAPLMQASYSGAIYFKSDNIGNTIDFGGLPINNWGIIFNGDGDWTFTSDLNALNTMILLDKGVLYANGKTLNFSSFNTFSNSSRTFDLGNSILNVGTWSVFFPSSFNLIAGTSLINITQGNFTGGGKTYYDLNITSAWGSVFIAGSSSFNNFTASGAITDVSFETGTTTSVNSFSVPSGSCTQMLSIGSAWGASTISMPSGTFTGDYLKIQNFTATGGANFIATNSIGVGNNNGWNITNPASVSMYWVGGTGAWDDTTHWSYTSGGGSAHCLPNQMNNVIFDGNSFSGPGQTVSINSYAICNSMDWTLATNMPTLAGFGNLEIFGSLTFSPSMIHNATGQLIFSSSNVGNTINTGGNPLMFNSIIFNSSGSWSLTSPLSCNQISCYNGAFSTNNFPIIATGFYAYTTSPKTIDLGSSIINIIGDWALDNSASNIVLNSGSSTITITGNNFSGGSLIYHDVFLTNGANVNITGNNTFNVLNISSANNVSLSAASVQTVTNLSLPSGTCSGYKKIYCYSSGQQASLVQTSGIVSANYCNIQDIAVSGGATFNATNSIDFGNNSGWNFTAPAAQNYYWIGGTGTWSDAAHWSYSSGGLTAGCIPTLNDNVYFDANSFSGGAKTVSVNADAYCKNMDWTGVSAAHVLAGSGNSSINIYGSLKLAAAMNLSFGGMFNFKSNVAGNTIDLAGKTIPGYAIFNGNGEWTFTSTFNASYLSHDKGSIITDNYPVNLTSYYSSTTEVKNLQLGSSIVTLTGSWAIFDATNYTLNAGTSQINCTGSDFRGGNQVYNNVLMSSNFAVNIYAANTFNSLIISNSKEVYFEGNKTQNITSLIFQNGISCSNLSYLSTLTPGAPAALALQPGTINSDYMQITDVKVSGTTCNALNSYGIGDVSGWNIGSPATQNYYWIGGTGNWSDPMHWSLTSGGIPASCAPGILDNVFFDNNSFTVGGSTVTVDVNAFCNSMDWTGVLNMPTFTGFTNLTLNGSLTLSPNMNNTFSSSYIFSSSNLNNTIDLAGQPLWAQVYFNGSGSWNLMSDVNSGGGGPTIYFNNGTFNTNNYSLDLGFGNFISNSTNSRTLNLGFSNITLMNWDIQDGTGLVLNADHSVIDISGWGFQFRGGNKTYNKVNLGSFSVNIYDSNVYDTLIISQGMTVVLESGKTQTINILETNGSNGNNVILNSSIIGSQSTINIVGGKFCGDYFTIKDQIGLGGPLFAGVNSINDGNNSGWVFSVCPAPLTVSINDFSNVTCNGLSNGWALASVSGGTPPYSYSWTNGNSVDTATVLSPGWHYVTVNDFYMYAAVDSILISEPDVLVLSGIGLDLLCNGDVDGAIDISVVGGTTGYTFSWNFGQTTEDISSLSAGSYFVTVTDAQSCIDTLTVLISEPSLLNLSIASTTDVICNGDSTGSIDVFVTGGTTPYTYSWDNGEITEDISALAEGFYSITVTDANNCVGNAMAQIFQNAALGSNQALTLCSGQSYSIGGNSYATTGVYSDTLVSALGCDSIVTTDIEFLMPVVFNNPQSICDGSSYSNNGNTYTVAGIYLDTLNAANGCDSIVVTDLTVNPVTNSNEIASICSGQSYSFGGSNLTTSGNYNYTYSSIYGCDSIVTLDLTVVDTIKVTMSASICEGQSYTFGSQTLIAAGAYTDLSVSAGGCDSLTTLLFTVNSKDSIGMVESICEGSSYLFNGDFYSNDTIITANLMNINGCDSLVTLALSIIPTQITAASAAICDNGSYLFGGTNLSSAGSYSHTFVAVNGCDSVVNLDLYVYATHSENISASICEGQSYSFGGNNYNLTGVYSHTVNNMAGCDSTTTLTLTVNEIDSLVLDVQVCMGGSYVVDGNSHNTTGTYVHTMNNITGCDSVVTLNLTVVDTIKVTMSASICEGQSYTFGAQTLIAAGTYTDLSLSAGGCDSLTTLLFSVNSKDSIGMVESICEGSSYLFNGDLYSNDTIITANLMNINGCDSLVTLALSIIPTQITAASAAICANGSYLFGGTNLSSAGSYSHTFIAVNGCDSVVNLDLNVYATHSENISASICEGQSYSFGGNNYNLTGVYSHTVNNMAGCDSTTTLTLTVNEIDSLVLDVQVCMGGSYVVDGNSHNTTGTYVHTMNNITGCDSVVTLNLTVVDTIKVTLYASVCEGQSYTFGAQTLSTSGTYTDLSTSLIGGCDSVTTLYLTINTKDSLGMSTSICNGDVYLFNGVEYSTSGMHSVTLTNLSGCDSIVTLDLTVNDLPIVDFTFNQDSICDYDSPITLSATPSGGVFSGVGVVGNSFNPYGFSVAGYASVQYVYSDFNGCTSTSTDSIFVDICIGITSNNNSKIGVYPNPNRGLFKMVNANSSAEYIEITNAFGAIVYKGFTSDGGVVNIQNLAPGVYTLQSKNEHIKIVKE